MRRKFISAIAVAFMLGVVPLAAARAAAVAGQVLALAGQPLLLSSGQGAPLKMGDPVHVGDTVQVPAGAKLKLRMIDGSVISVAAGSQLTIQAYGVDAAGHRDAELSLGGGLLRAAVASVTQPAKFEVSTGTGVAAVRSTDWFVSSQAGVTQVGVLQGTVDLTSLATRRSVAIPARWGARVLAGMDPVPARVWTPQEFADVIQRTDLP